MKQAFGRKLIDAGITKDANGVPIVATTIYNIEADGKIIPCGIFAKRAAVKPQPKRKSNK